MKDGLHKVALQGRWPSKTMTVNDGFYRNFKNQILYTVEPVIYDHPLVPVILVANDGWS